MRSLIVVPPNHDLYSAASTEVMDRLHLLSPLVEQISIDEAFIDVSDLPEDGLSIAQRLQAQINHDLNLPCSFGVATNKLVAKIANDEGKRRNKSENPPNAITVVTPGDEAAFLSPLPVIALWGVGPKTAERLHLLGVRTIGDLAQRSISELESLFGKIGHDLSQRARGIDPCPLTPQRETKSISQEITFNQDIHNVSTLTNILHDLAESVGRKLRKDGLQGKTIKLKLRWSDFTTLTRQTTLLRPSDQDEEIYTLAKTLFEKEWQAQSNAPRSVRLLGVGVSSLVKQAQQLELWETQTGKGRRLQTALDQVRDKFGGTAIQRGKTK